jgi:hypothetical protein
LLRFKCYSFIIEQKELLCTNRMNLYFRDIANASFYEAANEKSSHLTRQGMLVGVGCFIKSLSSGLRGQFLYLPAEGLPSSETYPYTDDSCFLTGEAKSDFLIAETPFLATFRMWPSENRLTEGRNPQRCLGGGDFLSSDLTGRGAGRVRCFLKSLLGT